MRSFELLSLGVLWLMLLCTTGPASASAISTLGRRSPDYQAFISPGLHESTRATSEDPESEVPDIDGLDRDTFEQILDMDESDDDREFSKSLVFDFFQQAEETLKKLDEAASNSDLEKLSALGHFLKGSSATMGLTYVRDDCEKIQHYGAMWGDAGETLSDKDSLHKIKELLPKLKAHLKAVEKPLLKFYGEE